MTRKEAIKINKIFKDIYGATLDWYEIIRDYPYKAVKEAMYDFIKQDGREYLYPPSPRKVLERINRKVGGALMLMEQAKAKTAYNLLPDNCGLTAKQYMQIVLLEKDIDSHRGEIIELCCG